jgi:hypothetical protein
VSRFVKVAVLLLAAAVVGSFAGLVWGAAEVLERRPTPATIVPLDSSTSPEPGAR